MADKKVKIPKSTAQVKDLQIKPQSGTEKTLMATWVWGYKNTASFNVKWEYNNGQGWILASTGTTDNDHKNSLYTPPDNAQKVRVQIQPVSTTYIKDNKETNYWVVTSWTKSDNYKISSQIIDLDPPSAPTLSISQYTLTASATYSNAEVKAIRFYIISDSTKQTFGPYDANLYYGKASVQLTVGANQTYRAICYALSPNKEKYNDSDASDPSSEVMSPPSTPEILRLEGSSSSSVKIILKNVTNAETYNIQYVNNESDFNNTNAINSTSIDVTVYESTELLLYGLDSGKAYFFRIQASNSAGSSGWSSIKFIILGLAPDKPTVWSSTHSGLVGDNVILYWTHNTRDGSVEEEAILKIALSVRKTDGSSTSLSQSIKVLNELKSDDNNNTFYYVINLNSLLSSNSSIDGYVTKMEWQVQTKGVYPTYSPLSDVEVIQFYTRPMISIKMAKTHNWLWDPFNFETDDKLTAFGGPGEFYEEPITVSSFPIYSYVIMDDYQDGTPVQCLYSIYATEDYDSLNHLGETVKIIAGTEIYKSELKMFFNIKRPEDLVDVFAYHNYITPMEISLENNITYKIKARVVYDNGMYAETELDFDVLFDMSDIGLNAEISYDPDLTSVYIQPFAFRDKDDDSEDENIEILSYTYLDVYRRNFDGDFTLIAFNINNEMSTTVIDPHPTLKSVQYRIAAKSLTTSKIVFTDLPGYPIPEAAIIIQWDDEWRSFDTVDSNPFSDPVQKTSMLKLPYNIEISESNTMDNSLVEYIGRKHPVSYYGTQVGQTLELKCDIVANDLETIYQLRRLSVWPGDVYIREPSGNGYWAQVSVSFSMDYKGGVIVPVTLSVTRVEGGV